jgi:hypothetical protein
MGIRPSSKERRRIVAAWLLGSLLALLLPDAALASDCPSDNRVIVSPDNNARGVRVGLEYAGMLVVDNTTPCARASTLSVVNNFENRAVEIGWYEEGTNVTPCPQTTVPRVLRAWFIFGEFHCDQTTALIGDTPRKDDFRVQDQNQDGIWGWWRNGNHLGNTNMDDFRTGDPRAQGERKSDHSDEARSEFLGLYRMINASDYVVWGFTTTIKDTDPDYVACRVDGDDHRIRVAHSC